MYVQTYMTPDLVTIPSYQDAAEALRVMRRHGIRRLPVLDQGKLVGIVTLHGLYRVLPENVNPAKAALPPTFRTGSAVGEIMDREVITAKASEPLEDVAQRMREHKISGVPVVRRGEVVGIITESDIFRVFAQVMGAGLGGVRIAFDLKYDPTCLGDILQSAKVYGITVNSLAMCRSLTGERVTVTMRIDGQDVERFVRSLWNSGYRVVGVIPEEDEGAPAE